MLAIEALPRVVRCELRPDLLARALIAIGLAVVATASLRGLRAIAPIAWGALAIVTMIISWAFEKTSAQFYLLANVLLALTVLTSVARLMGRATTDAGVAAGLAGWNPSLALLLLLLSPFRSLFHIEAGWIAAALGIGVGIGLGLLALRLSRSRSNDLGGESGENGTTAKAASLGALDAVAVALIALLVTSPKACLSAMSTGPGSQYSVHRDAPETCTEVAAP